MGVFRQFALCVRSRLSALFNYSFASVIGLVVASRGVPPLSIALAVPASVSCIILSIYLYNDICDMEDDKRGAQVGKIFPSMRPPQSRHLNSSEASLPQKPQRLRARDSGIPLTS